MMPGMNGWEFRAEQARDPLLADIPVVLLSGAGDVQAEARKLGARAFVTKPFLPAQLIAAIDGVAA
jgi:CheY-like chemotaxis protein